jgi:hypothetical protein
MADDASITIKLDPQTAAQLAARAREEGVTPEQYAAEVVAEAVDIDLSDLPPPPGSIVSEEELRRSIEEQMRKIESGEAALFPHEQVVAEARAIIEAAKARKG